MKPPVVDVAYHDLGGVGPVLVMFHPNSLCGRVFKPMVQLLGRHFRCIALDAPGQGSSPPWPSHLPISFDGIIDCMHAKVLSLGLQ
ncbi:pimelyl-[acyl-carrier protein] methyl ester esterase, partial [Haematococcus lacustris]